MSRTYDRSGRAARAEASRRAVLDAARALFARDGIDRVTIAEVARVAGVGASSVYAAFRSKSGLLRALMQDALFGPRYREALSRLDGETDPVTLVAKTAQVARAIYEGEDQALGLVRGASAFAPELRAVEAEFETLRYRMQADRVRALHAAGRLADGLSVDEARRILWTLTNREIYRSLVTVAGWSPARYERWLTGIVRSQLVAPQRRRTTRGAPMTVRRVLPPAPPAPGRKLTGPPSYFASIEKTYGKPIQHWLDVAVALLETHTHMQAVTAMKTTHHLGHGHANAVVAYVRAALDR